jgi:WD40 repeat protein
VNAEKSLLAVAVNLTTPGSPRSDRVDIFNSQIGTLLGSIPISDTAVSNLAFSADGNWLAIATQDGFVRTWSTAPLELTSTIVAGGAFEAGPISWSPTEPLIAAGVLQQILVTDVIAQQYTSYNESQPATTLQALSWSADGLFVASSYYQESTSSGFINVWEPDFSSSFGDLTLRFTVVGNDSIAWSPAGSELAANRRGGVTIYDISDGTEQRQLNSGSNERIFEVQWSPDGTELAAGSDNGLWIWNAIAGEVIAHELMAEAVTDIAWLPNGQVLHNGGEFGLAINGEQLESYVLPPSGAVRDANG